jgi:type I restriction enzyme S subunit
MDADTAALFPDSFEESELGEIPRGWRTATLADVCVLNPESWSRQTRPSVIKYVDLSNTKWGRIEAVAHYPCNEAPSRAQRVLMIGDTIVGTVRPGNGSYALVSVQGLTGSTGFAVLRPLGLTYAEFVYLAATSRDNIDVLSHLADGGAYPAVSPDDILATPVARAPDDLLERFSGVVRGLLAQVSRGDSENHMLVAIRDALLPRLLSGDLPNTDSEPAAEAQT